MFIRLRGNALLSSKLGEFDDSGLSPTPDGAGHWPERKMQSIANASHKRYNGNMKTATIPPVRIDPSFRKDIEQSLEGGESLASLVETAVRNEVTRRRVQSEFIRRGMAAINRTVAAGDGVPAEVVIAKLEAKLAAARSAKKAA
jgi:predicted transcriptional regulator